MGHSLLDSQELLLCGVDGGMLTQDMAVITGLWPLCGLQGKVHTLQWAKRSRGPSGQGTGGVSALQAAAQVAGGHEWSQAEE